jgi:hypothetical protein
MTMTLAMRRPSVIPAAVLLGLFFILSGFGALCNQAEAGCTDYQNYLNWMSIVDLPAVPSDIAFQGNYAYITLRSNGFKRLVVIDIANERLPKEVANLDFSFEPMCIAVSDSIALVGLQATGGDGLVIVNIGDPTAPTILDSTLTNTDCLALEIAGGHAYVTSDSPANSFIVVDILNPALPESVATVPLPGPPSAGMVINGDYVYVPTDGDTVLNVVHIATPESPSVGYQYTNPTRSPTDIAMHSGELFIAIAQDYGNAEVLRFWLSNPAQPQYHNSCAVLAANLDPKLAVDDGILYVGSETGNVQMIDVTTNSCQLIGELPYPGSYLAGLAISDYSLFYLTQDPVDSDGRLHIISVSSPGPLVPISSVLTPGTAEDVIIAPGRADLAYVADGAAGLQVVDVTDPLNPVVIGTADTPGYAVNVALLGNTVFVADSGAGIAAIDVTVSTAPSLISSVDTPGSAVDIALTLTHAYVAVSDQGVRVIDIQTPAAMKIVGVQDTLTASTGIEVSGLQAYVADGNDGLVVLNASDPSNPWIIDQVKGGGLETALKVDYSHGNAYVTDAANGLFVFDVTDPVHPTMIGSIETIDDTGDVDIMGIFAYVGSGSNMQLIDIQDDANPIAAGNVEIPTQARGIFIDPYYAYVAAGNSGLQVCPAQCGFDETVIADFAPDVQAGFFPHTVNFINLSEGYGLNYIWDFGDSTGTSTEAHPTYTFNLPSDYTVTLIATNGSNFDTTAVVVSALSEPPIITSIVDVPQDQGGYVYVDFYRCGYDDTDPNKSEMYTIQRQDAGTWVTVATSGAYGDHYYSALAITQGDGDGWTTPFRVIAHMDEGIWISAPMTGYSEDNIAPEAPANVIWLGDRHLGWDPVAANDFAYYRIYGSMQPSLEGAVSLATTIDTDIMLGELTLPWVLVVAVDDYGLESEPSLPLVVTGVPEPVTAVELSKAIPNPFNPSTVIGYALPKPGHARLCIYDVSGCLVRVLVDEHVAAGRHEAIWQGRDDAGRSVASGTYFSRLEAGGKVRIGRMVLIK